MLECRRARGWEANTDGGRELLVFGCQLEDIPTASSTTHFSKASGLKHWNEAHEALGPPRPSKRPAKARQLSCVPSLNTRWSATLRLSVMTIGAGFLFQNLTKANRSG